MVLWFGERTPATDGKPADRGSPGSAAAAAGEPAAAAARTRRRSPELDSGATWLAKPDEKPSKPCPKLPDVIAYEVQTPVLGRLLGDRRRDPTRLGDPLGGPERDRVDEDPPPQLQGCRWVVVESREILGPASRTHSSARCARVPPGRGAAASSTGGTYMSSSGGDEAREPGSRSRWVRDQASSDHRSEDDDHRQDAISSRQLAQVPVPADRARPRRPRGCRSSPPSGSRQVLECSGIRSFMAAERRPSPRRSARRRSRGPRSRTARARRSRSPRSPAS